MRTFVVGDIHGQHRALVACLKAVQFDYRRDRLIVLGDVCDRGPNVREAFDELLKIKNCIYLVGNHDIMALEWAETGRRDENWLSQGGDLTYRSYAGVPMPEAHRRLIRGGRVYFEDAGQLFLHAGFDPRRPVAGQPRDFLTWDRELVGTAWEAHRAGRAWRVPGYSEVFVGHTPTLLFGSSAPLHLGNLWLLDTGAGYSQMLTIMEAATGEYRQERAGA